MSADMGKEAVSARLREASALADLNPERRLDAKIDYSRQAVSRRLRQVEQLRRACQRLGAAGRALQDGEE